MTTTLDEWTTAVCAELDLDAAQVPVPALLDLTRSVAHQVLRPGAPIAAYLLGIAVGRGAEPAEAANRLRDLVANWPVQLGSEGPGDTRD